MTSAVGFGKCAARALAVLLMLLATSCSDSAPTGQVLARIDGDEVTFREWQHDLALFRSDATASKSGQNAIFERLIDRRILANEALERGLDRDETFHFALRYEQERLLVEALKRDIRADLEASDSATLDDLVASQPWRYRDRFLLSLSRAGNTGQTITTLLDSWNYRTQPERSVLGAKVGDVIDIDGEEWRLLDRRSDPIIGEAAAKLAKREAESDQIDRRMRLIVATMRQSGQIQFQSGFGPASR